MTPSLTLEQAASFVPHRPAPPAQVATPALPPTRTATVLSFVERRQADSLVAAHSIRSPVVLTFAGVMGGLLLSALLIALVAIVLAVCAVSWPNASRHCIATVVFIFGTAGLVLYWDAAHTQARLLAWIERAIERRGYYLHLSSLDALENVRNLNNWARAGMGASDNVPIQLSHRAPVQPIRSAAHRATRSTAEHLFADTGGDATGYGTRGSATSDWHRAPGQTVAC
ncbi:MAG: hypothetical protein IV085_09855 [Thiobacillus sp.]|nr:hypothetical protein [Thiobacillus sp.]